jgi:hypothetical protein
MLGAMLPVGDHSLHEVMRSAELFGQVNDYPGLTYDDSWGRYWRLPLLSEQELRAQVARDGKFPDEHARELMESAGRGSQDQSPSTTSAGCRRDREAAFRFWRNRFCGACCGGAAHHGG